MNTENIENIEPDQAPPEGIERPRTNKLMEEAADAEEAERERLAARVRGAAVPTAEEALRADLERATNELAEQRSERDAREERIRDLVFEVETLTQAVGVFDRRRAKAAER